MFTPSFRFPLRQGEPKNRFSTPSSRFPLQHTEPSLRSPVLPPRLSRKMETFVKTPRYATFLDVPLGGVAGYRVWSTSRRYRSPT